MKRMFNAFKYGFGYLLGDDLISYYVFFTMIFAGCAWLFAFCELSVAIPLAIITEGYVANTILFSWLKGNAEGTRLEVVFAVCYVAVFLTLFIIGCIINIKVHFIMMAIILAVTAICVWIREYQLPVLFQSLALCAPMVTLAICFAQISLLPIVLKILIPVIYGICSPLIAYYEDSAAAQNIFELAYEITWSKEYEERMKKFENCSDNSDKDETKIVV